MNQENVPEAVTNLAISDANDAVQPVALSVKFSGNSRDYFRIWIVNLCLSLLTFGLFSAWAKVRKKRYFYSHTTLDGTPFQYMAQPFPIFKGRVIAVALFLFYYVSINFYAVLLPYVIAAGLIIAPWVIARSAAFNARYSAYRNMTFRFDGNYLGALKTLYMWGLVPVLAVCTLIKEEWALMLAGFLMLVFGIAFPWWIKRLRAFIIGNTVFGEQTGQFSATGGQFFKIYFLAGLLTMAGGMLLMPVMILGAAAGAVKFIPFLPYLVYLLAFVYIQARIGNLVWNNTRLGPVRFHSTLKATEMTKLYFTNTLGIIVSLGLLIPWAVIRTLKYRADHMNVLLDGSMSDFRGHESNAVQAAGAEMGDFFNVDFSI